MRCRDADNLLAQYADDALSAAQRDEVEAHLAACPVCREELAAMERALTALSRAAAGPAPDLWAAFQSRLAAEAAPVDCAFVSERLPAYGEGELPPEEGTSIRHHLTGCAACGREEATLATALARLDASAKTPAPDLWSSFQARLAEELRCSEAEELLPAFRDGGLRGVQAGAVRAHLEHCTVCAASLVQLETALSALDRTAAVPRVELWPRFAARLAREENRRSGRGRSSIRSLMDGLAGVFHQPAVRPALGLAAAVLVAVMVRTVVTAPRGETVLPGPQVARVEEPLQGPEPVAPAERRDPAVSTARPDVPSATPVRRRRVRAQAEGRRPRGERRVRVRRQPRASTLVAARPKRPVAAPELPERRVPSPAELIAKSVPTADPVAGGSEVNTPGAKNRVMPEVVQLVGLLAGAQDSSLRAFEASFENE